jgi:REP element-mobilizing transposase RayT
VVLDRRKNQVAEAFQPRSNGKHAAARPRRFILEGDVYHTISTTTERRPVFADAKSARIVIDSLDFLRREGRAHFLAYALLPDHLHLIVAPRAPYTVSQVMQSIKGHSARIINAAHRRGGRLWQPGFYDRVIRNEEHLQTAIEYVEANPVAAGLCARAREYTFCSAHPDALVDIDAWMYDDRGKKASAT